MMSTKFKSLLRIAFIAAVAISGLSLTDRSSSAQPCPAVPDPKAKADELFKVWNDALVGGKADPVVARYAVKSVLLATVSNEPRLTPAEKKDYFEHFQEKGPSGRISSVGREVFHECNTLIDAGVYIFRYKSPGKGPELTHARYSFTYRFANNSWLITSHHSSAMPEEEFICPVKTPGSPAAQVCPSACSKPTDQWAWGDWLSTGAGGTETLCQCLRTPKKKESSTPPGCSTIPNG